MEEQTYIAHARTDANDRLVAADEPLAALQRRCGGEIPGTIAIPELREQVRKARRTNLRLGRTIHAYDGNERIKAWMEIVPADEVIEGVGQLVDLPRHRSVQIVTNRCRAGTECG